MKAGDKVYEFLYNDTVEESAYATISIHLTKVGAERAMEEHKAKKREEYLSMIMSDPEYGEMFEFGLGEDWKVIETEIQD